ncbi:hypothetical protein JCM11641_008358 [Rhodosporidiobolus odoratus]
MQRSRPVSPSLDVPHESSSNNRAPTSPRLRTSFSQSRATPAASSAYAMPEEHKRQLSGSGRRSGSGLPLYTGGNGAGGNGRRGGAGTAGWLSGRLKHGKGRWILLSCLLLGLWLWRSDRVGPPSAGSETADKPRVLIADRTAPDGLDQPFQPADLFQDESEPPSTPPPHKPNPAPLPPLPPPSPESSAETDKTPIDIPVRPVPSPVSHRNPSERFLAYSPHSGYHNQRISLENAFTLAFLTKRTLLLPPIWFGHAIPYISFEKLQRRLEMASKEGFEHCIAYGDGSAADPIPRECDGYWDWTAVDWSFLVDLSEAEKLVPIIRRDNLSIEWMGETLGLHPADKRGRGGDTYHLKDDTMYQYRFYDSLDDDEPLLKWGNRLDMAAFKEETDPYKLLHVGTLFGTSRLRTTLEENFDARSAFRKSMVFRTEIVDDITQQVRDLLGGEGRYYGLHLRVGDGVFQKEAKENMRGVWEKLCVDKMKLSQEVCDEVREKSERKSLRRRDEPSLLLSSAQPDPTPSASTHLAERGNSRPQREGAFHHAPLPPLPLIRTLADSPLSASLPCRASLHTNPSLLPFNAPLFIATDSPLPSSHPHLRAFFDAFPCTFVLSDFSHLPALGRMNRMRNQEDKTPLAGFLYPQLDAQIAAWGRGFVGTPQSTYSRFAADVLHQVYHGWEIIERG